MTLSALPLPAPDARLELWQADLDQPLRAESLAWLSPAERQRAASFVRPVDAHRYQVARCLLRQLLALRTGVPPPELALRVTTRGKPFLQGARCQFNLSHSGNRFLLGFSDQACVGVDLEVNHRAIDALDDLARVVMARSEWAHWCSLLPAQREAAFYRLWVRKEACLKAWGFGLFLEPASLELPGTLTAVAHASRVAAPASAGVPAPELLLYDLRMADNVGLQAAVALGSAA